MKRSFSIIALLVAMVFVFAACGGPAVPTLTDRWQDGEMMYFESELPEDFLSMVEAWRRYSSASACYMNE